MKNNEKLVIKLAYLLRLKDANLISDEEYMKLKGFLYTKYKGE